VAVPVTCICFPADTTRVCHVTPRTRCDRPVEATPPAEFARLLDLNTIGALRVAQAVLPGMRARGRGRLLFVSSVAGRIARPRQGASAATKRALEALVEALVIEAGPLGIEAALLEPGAVSSGALDHVTTYTLPGDPYAHLSTQGGARARQMITPKRSQPGSPTRPRRPSFPCAFPSAGPLARSWPRSRSRSTSSADRRQPAEILAAGDHPRICAGTEQDSSDSC
jgi:NAD(P)-dependent dehydrogenase (short-subunit alcohol dehydrogenase family)